MKTYEERTEDILSKVRVCKQKVKTRKRITTLAVTAMTTICLAVVLFFPYPENLPDVSAYRDSPYYNLIQKLSMSYYTPPEYKNNFEKLVDSLGSMNQLKGEVIEPGIDMEGALPEAPVDGTSGTYQEVTDNQVAGVIEADLIKRTDQYIYYLSDMNLYVYSIAGEESVLVNNFPLFPDEDGYDGKSTAREMYLSEDCKTLTILCHFVQPKVNYGTYVRILTFSIENGKAIEKEADLLISGNYLSSRLVDGKLLLMSQFYIGRQPNFSEEATFLPQIGTLGNMNTLPSNDVIFPETITDRRYMVVTSLDSKTLEVYGAAALLSYNPELYVSKNYIFATRSYTNVEKMDDNRAVNVGMTEIICLDYSGETLENKGSCVVEGTVKDQYSMDEKDGVLRVVTSTSTNVYTEYSNGSVSSVTIDNRARNANLYCISIGDWKTLALIEGFAPPGESVQSVRFDGDTAYVCTSLVFSDPVFFFDLSDLRNITWKDTGTIEGYSSSLVNFGNGNLLGIGFESSGSLKVEIYEESSDGVISVAKYVRQNTGFSLDYKSYFIDREHQLIGLGIDDYTNVRIGKYILLHFDGYNLNLLAEEEMIGMNQEKRGVVIDDYLYMFWADQFKVAKVW